MRPYVRPAVALVYVFLPTLVVFVAMDVAWIYLVAGEMYKAVLGMWSPHTDK